jgi:hypothetical protein
MRRPQTPFLPILSKCKIYTYLMYTTISIIKMKSLILGNFNISHIFVIIQNLKEKLKCQIRVLYIYSFTDSI